MIYHVAITETAWVELRRAYRWIRARSPVAAERWCRTLLAAVDSLEQLPARCPLAPEADALGKDVRQLFHGKRRSRYRILFQVRGRTVYVLRIRHGSQDLLKPEDLQFEDE